MSKIVWRRIKDITWFESSNPGVFTIQIRYDPSGIKGALCRTWLRGWVPALVKICKGFLGMSPERTAVMAKRIRKSVKEVKKA